SRRSGSPMKGTFHPFDEVRDVVERQTGEKTKITGGHLEGRLRGRRPASGQAGPQRLVDDLAKGSSGSPRFRLELRGNVIVQGQSRTHVSTLCTRHHDVNDGRPDAARIGVRPGPR